MISLLTIAYAVVGVILACLGRLLLQYKKQFERMSTLPGDSGLLSFGILGSMINIFVYHPNPQTETMVGKQIEVEKGKKADYIDALHRIGESFYKRMASPWLWLDFIYDRTKLNWEYEKDLEIVHSFTNNVLSEKKESYLKRWDNAKDEEKESTGKYRKLFVDYFLDLYLCTKQFTEKDVKTELDSLMFAGHDTVSVALHFIFHTIGLYPDVQKKIYKEIQEIFGDDEERMVSMEDTRRMTYLECTIKECLRLYPPAPLIGRKLNADINCNGLVIPKGSNVTCNIIGLHRNPDYFPDPEKFDPDRFLSENILNRHPYSYVPFSAGS